MVFRKSKEELPDYDVLPIETKYRFAEIEINQAADTLFPLFRNKLNPRYGAIATIFNVIVPHGSALPEFEDNFLKASMTSTFMRPHKDELINYFKFRGLSYAKIRAHTGASPNTIYNKRFDYPHFTPVYHQWNEEMLHRWLALAPTINIFNEELLHSFY
jgi:hypothetical protein